jgi:cellulose biosynthesis protein BcsQ
MPAKIVSFASTKGGVSKSAICVQTGSALQKKGHNTIIYDNDPQCTSFNHANRTDEANRVPTHSITRPIMQNDLNAAREIYDYILIDGRGHVDNDPRLERANKFLAELTEDPRIPEAVKEDIDEELVEIFGANKEVKAAIIQLVKLSDFVVIPWGPSAIDVKGGMAVLSALRTNHPETWQQRYAFIATQFKAGTKTYEKFRSAFAERNINLFRTGFSNRTAWEQFSDSGTFAYEPSFDDTAYKQMNMFIDELTERLEKQTW